MRSKSDLGPKEDLLLYGVVGLERQAGRMGTLSLAGANAGPRKDRRRYVRASESVSFVGPRGTSITITSHRSGDHRQYEQIRQWAPMNTYLQTPSGRATLASRGSSELFPQPIQVEWRPVTILVDGQQMPFDVCDLESDFWAAVGRPSSVDVTISSCGVPLDLVVLERIERHNLRALPMPHLGAKTDALSKHLDERIRRIPFKRVNRWADYWALRDIEVEHVARLACQHLLSRHEQSSLEAHWLARIHNEVGPTLDQLEQQGNSPVDLARMARRLRFNFLFQLWFNTLGPGARTWFGNRYTTIRHYTFRIHWRS